MGFSKLGSNFGEIHLDDGKSFVKAGELRHPFNLHRRPSSRLAAATNVGTEASGSIPAAVLDGSAADLWLGRGDREGPDCFSDLSERSSPQKLGTYVLFSQYFGVFCCTPPLFVF
jgi:hypothetical protein